MSMNRLQRVRLATVAILGLVLVSGFLTGMAWDRRLGDPPQSAVADSARDGERRVSRRAPIYESVRPELSEAELASAREIMERRRAAARALFEEPVIDSLYDAMKGAEKAFRTVYDPRFRALVDSARGAIKQILGPAQVAHYDSLLAESDRRRREERSEGSN